MAVPGVAIMVMLVTLGLTYPLLFILPMATILLWALLPAVLARGSWLRWPALALGLALLASLLLLPGMADRKAQRLIEAKGLVSAQPATFSRPSGVEIIRNVTDGEAPCFDICERLLTGGDVAWVRIVMRDDAFANAKAVTSARLILARDADCHALSAEFLAEGSTCILVAPDAQDAAYVASLLALGPSLASNSRSNAFAQVVTGWQRKLQWKKPTTEADRLILCASLEDTLMLKSFWAVQLRNKSLRCD